MLTIKNDLVDEILKPLGVKYLYDEKQEKISVVKKISDKWDFIVPSTVQRELGLFSDGDLSCIVNGWESSHSNHNDSTDSCRSVLKKRLQEKNCDLYSEMHEHIHEMLQSNAFLREYQKENKCRDNNIKFREVERFCKENDIQEMYERLITGHPSYAAAYVEYASYLLSAGDGGAAVEVYRKAETCPDAENEPNFASVGMKLKNAGLI